MYEVNGIQMIGLLCASLGTFGAIVFSGKNLVQGFRKFFDFFADRTTALNHLWLGLVFLIVAIIGCLVLHYSLTLIHV